MAEVDEREFDQPAREIVGALLNGEAPPIPPEGVSIADVERDTKEFLRLRDLYDFVNEDMLVLVTPEGSLVPFLPRSLFGVGLGMDLTSGASLYWFLIRESSYSLIKQILTSAIKARRAEYPPEVTRVISRDEATESFLAGATAFVRKRLGWRKRTDWAPVYPTTQLRIQMISGGGQATVTACLFTIQSNSAGLQVLWTPAYAHAQNYFGSPTSPVQAPLQAGSYRFGVLGGAYVSPQWALPVHTLPGVPHAHLPY